MASRNSSSDTKQWPKPRRNKLTIWLLLCSHCKGETDDRDQVNTGNAGRVGRPTTCDETVHGEDSIKDASRLSSKSVVVGHTKGYTVDSTWQRAVAKCPEACVEIGPVKMQCLLDARAQVSSYHNGIFLLGTSSWEQRNVRDVSPLLIRISAAHCLGIPYLGYIELPLQIAEHTFENVGFLIVRDPVDISEAKIRFPWKWLHTLTARMKLCIICYQEFILVTSTMSSKANTENVEI